MSTRVGTRYVADSNRNPQKRQTRAAALIVSAQSGRAFVSAAPLSCSTAGDSAATPALNQSLDPYWLREQLLYNFYNFSRRRLRRRGRLRAAPFARRLAGRARTTSARARRSLLDRPTGR